MARFFDPEGAPKPASAYSQGVEIAAGARRLINSGQVGMLPDGTILPGYGAQGGAAKDVAAAFDSNGLGAVINASRSIHCAWQKNGAAEQDYAKAAAREAVRMRNEIVKEIGTLNLNK